MHFLLIFDVLVIDIRHFIIISLNVNVNENISFFNGNAHDYENGYVDSFYNI
jgi:hypothetical protein